MSGMDVTMQRPRRWDVPFSSEMTHQEVQRLLRVEPFASMDPARFPAGCSLPDILLNDTRVQRYQAGDIIVREGDYGASAFLVLRGSVHVFLEALAARMLGRREPAARSRWRALHPLSLAQHFGGSKVREVRKLGTAADDVAVGRRGGQDNARIFLQDLPRMLDCHDGTTLGVGEIFGEVAAMSRSPRSSTIVAKEDCALLELRWQGLRDLMRRAPEWRKHIEHLYRKNSLEDHLRETPLVRQVKPDDFPKVMQATQFESYGEFEWQAEFRAVQHARPKDRLDIEPVIAREGELPDGILLIRSGFARLSRHYGDGHQTLAYLSKGQMYGLEEIANSWVHKQPRPLRYSLRAIGYVDVLRIPTDAVQRFVLPTLSRRQLQRLLCDLDDRSPQPSNNGAATAVRTSQSHTNVETGLLEFIVENRLMNGSQTMIIDLERCTRCDDCVRACAATHENNPRFLRDGYRYDRFLFAHACMHCVDPVCMIGCPTGAIARDERSGSVIINDQTCIGCATCANSCPYECIRMVEIRDPKGNLIVDEQTHQPIAKATKCDMCSEQAGGPACQRACPHDALVRMDMDNLPRLARWLER